MVNALRDEIDSKKHFHEEKLQKQNQLKTLEHKQLQETIIELRAELEVKNARKRKKIKRNLLTRSLKGRKGFPTCCYR